MAQIIIYEMQREGKNLTLSEITSSSFERKNLNRHGVILKRRWSFAETSLIGSANKSKIHLRNDKKDVPSSFRIIVTSARVTIMA